MDKQQTGRRGENLAAEFLARQGYTIIGQNVRSGRWGELDLVCVHNGDLVFVEVKTRFGEQYGLPIEAVSKGKQLRLRRAAQYYKLQHPETPDSLRFDVVAIKLAAGSGKPEIQLYKNIDA